MQCFQSPVQNKHVIIAGEERVEGMGDGTVLDDMATDTSSGRQDPAERTDRHAIGERTAEPPHTAGGVHCCYVEYHVKGCHSPG